MKCGRPIGIDRAGGCEQKDANVSSSTPEFLNARPAATPVKGTPRDRNSPRTPRGGYSASETHLNAKQNESAAESLIPIEATSNSRGDEKPISMQAPGSPTVLARRYTPEMRPRRTERSVSLVRSTSVKKTKSQSSEMLTESLPGNDSEMLRQMRDIYKEMRTSVRNMKTSRNKLLNLRKKTNLRESDVKTLSDWHESLLQEMDRFEKVTRIVQKVVEHEVSSQREKNNDLGYDPVMCQEMKMMHPTAALGGARAPAHMFSTDSGNTRSKSEIDLTRKLTESYDMQEKLVADNADLEVKRYILYKELMTKDQSLETCRAQIKRLQGELKLMSKENAMLHERISRNCPEGDASSINYEYVNTNESEKGKSAATFTVSQHSLDSLKTNNSELVSKLVSYQNSSTGYEEQIQSLESELTSLQEAMRNFKDDLKRLAENTCKAGPGPPSCARPTCNPPKPQPPPKKPLQPCNVCPPCQAPCNTEPPTPMEREVAKVNNQLKMVEETLNNKIMEISILRADVMKYKENYDKEKRTHKETSAKLKEAETRIEAMSAHHNMLIGNVGAGEEFTTNVKALKECYREAREEVDDLKLLLKEQNDQLQSYRNKYMLALQTQEEQKRQLELMDMDNTRISDQINLEIHKIRLNFQEKMKTLEPLTEELKRTRIALAQSQQSQAEAEHKAENLGKELIMARERIHVLLYNLLKPVPAKGEEAAKLLAQALKERIDQLMSQIDKKNGEIEQLKAKVIRLEEAAIVNMTRLQDKMQEVVVLGGELDATRDQAGRAVAQVNERMQTLRETMKLERHEMELQLIAARSQMQTIEKEREELKCRMSCQIKRLRDNFDKAQARILGLSTQLANIRNANKKIDEDDGESEDFDTCYCSVPLD